MSKYLTIAFLSLAKLSLNAQNEELKPGALGIVYTPEMQMCGDTLNGFPTVQYYEINGKNTKSSLQIMNEWRQFFQKPHNFSESGFLTIRFILDCEGKPRLHRFFEMGLDYQRKSFSAALKVQVWDFVQQLEGFPKGVYTYNNQALNVNYYAYFIFKIRNGEFESIAP